ncbi:MAG TPA: DegV family protein [Mycobacteriales bacterium]|jgi:DegV family protein with EDD domain|nr:DegV family protein [Mycobacteriales bacterium]
MPRLVRVVTDSTASIPADVAAAQGITVVPLSVTAGSKAGLEGVDVDASDVIAALADRRLPVSTSMPPPGLFEAAYAASGAAPIVSVHLSGALSGTYDAACRIAADAPVPVHVVDSRTIAMGLGFAVLAAARAAQAGAGPDEVAAVAQREADRSVVLFCPDSLEFLRRGGRIGAAAALLGTALAVKPVLHLADGQIAVRERVRTTSRAVMRLGELAENAVSAGTAELAVMHLDAPTRAHALAARLHERLPHCGPIGVYEVGAVIGAHTGPGTLGVAVHRL